ncbi:MAG TPA: sulfate adenylyltransferase [Candidatus Acidoferrales bacterium]|nr:sulfate adenylyltransferase [Candidatus Acidoferrales bacterium]
MALISPHGKEGRLLPLLLSGDALLEEKRRAATLPRVLMTSRETSDLIMMGIGAFTPLGGFMNQADWRGVCGELRTGDGTFWPIPITLSAARDQAGSLRENHDAALVDRESGELMGILTAQEKYAIDKAFECQSVFRTTDANHPGVAKVMAQGEVNLSGPVRVLSESYYPDAYKNLYLRPRETREIFAEKGWSTVAALQLRNPMHRSHEYLAKVALEFCDGLLIHQLLGKVKPGDIPAEVRVRAVGALVERYFVPGTCIQAGYPMEMRYAGPREALLHAVFRQNYGCSHLIVGRDHAGVGEYYGPFDSQRIFDQIPAGALKIRPLKVDWTFYCRRCDQLASTRTCPHGKDDRLIVSGTMLRKLLSTGQPVPDHFSRPEVLAILKEYYEGLQEEEKVEVKLHKYAQDET